MAKNNFTICPTCQQKVVDYPHNINKTLVSCLWALYKAGGLARLDKLNLNNTQFTNFQKLQYFNLIVKGGKNNAWQITRLGVAFLQGRNKIPKSVITRGGNVRQVSVERVFVQQVKECVQYKVEWQALAGQPTLFDQGK